MSCHDVASVLDTHRSARLGPAERAKLDAHLAACADCAAAWRAQTELLALPVPPMPSTLVERALLASRVPTKPSARRVRSAIIIGSALLAGAAFAAGMAVRSLRAPSEPTTSPAGTGQPAALPARQAERPEQSEAVGSSEEPSPATSVALVEVALGIQPIVRKNPDYPPDALKRGLEGYVQLQFDVTAAGTVTNVRVVESSDAQFEGSAARAVAGWRYLPRVVAGERVGSTDIQTIIRFVLQGDAASRYVTQGAPAGAKPLSDEVAQAAIREWTAFTADLEVAMERLAADDLRGVELQLDEMQALYGAERADLWGFYGYLYTVQRHYDRAIDAYERSVTIHERSQVPGAGPWVPLANLYFARHQYDIALSTLLRPAKASNGTLPPGATRLSKEADALIGRLRALGVTEETL